MVVARRTPLDRVGDDEDNEMRTGEEEGEGGAVGEGEGEADEEEEDEGALERRAERKRGNEPVWFHTRVSSPPSKSSSSSEDASSTSVSPAPSNGIVLPDVINEGAGTAFVGRLYVGKMRGGRGRDPGVGSCIGEDKGDRGGGGSRCASPYARKTKGMLPTPLRCGTFCVFRVIWMTVVSS